MFKTVIVMLKRAARVVRGIDIDALDSAHKLLLEGFQCQEIVAEDETVIENIVVSNTVSGVIGFFLVFQQDTWFQLGPILLPNPRQF
jgi:hypothetical protein